jgi:hypothetical protein
LSDRSSLEVGLVGDSGILGIHHETSQNPWHGPGHKCIACRTIRL